MCCLGERSYVTVAQFNVEGGAATTTPGKQETPHLKTPPPYLSWTHCCLENIITVRTRGHVIVLQEPAGDTKHPGVRVR